ncbi:MAG: putative lipid II flippase FtsW [Dehalococcoidia bacterium]
MAIVALLLVVGLLAVYSASYAQGNLVYGDVNYFIARQALWALVGLAALYFFMRLDYRLLRTLSLPIMAVALAGLVAVLVPGIGLERNGAARWLALGPLVVQPSEFAKLALIVYISAWLAGRGDHLKRFSGGFIPFTLIAGLVAWLILVEPDMGTAIILLLTVGTLFFVAGAPMSHLAVLLVGGALISGALILGADYRSDRIFSFTSAEVEPQERGYHTLQLLIGLGSGGATGLGWGASRQKLFYTPSSHTDGIFAIIGEELGFIGAAAVLILFGILLWRGGRAILQGRDQFGSLLVAGVVSWIAYQTLINIGGITRTLPLTGVPLPFISYGGSSLVATLAAVGVLLSVSRYGRDKSYYERESYQRARTARVHR